MSITQWINRMLIPKKPEHGMSRGEVTRLINEHYESQLIKYTECTDLNERRELKGLLMGYKSSLILLRA